MVLASIVEDEDVVVEDRRIDDDVEDEAVTATRWTTR
jgi:hypothetical protein